MDEAAQFDVVFFELMCTTLQRTCLISTTYHPQENVHFGPSNKVRMVRVPKFVVKRPKRSCKIIFRRWGARISPRCIFLSAWLLTIWGYCNILDVKYHWTARQLYWQTQIRLNICPYLRHNCYIKRCPGQKTKTTARNGFDGNTTATKARRLIISSNRCSQNSKSTSTVHQWKPSTQRDELRSCISQLLSPNSHP